MSAFNKSFVTACNLAGQVASDKTLCDQLDILAQRCAEAILGGRKILIAGNGGSHADAMHFAEEMTGRFRDDRQPFPAIALCSNPCHITCVGNDFGFHEIFAREVEALAKAGDVLILLSTSGNSENLVAAAWTVERNGLVNVHALLGGGCGSTLGRTEGVKPIYFPGATSDRIQELHMIALHSLVGEIERLVLAV